MTRVATLERVTRVTPLGVRFRDTVTGAFVSAGLLAEVHPKGRPDLRRAATVTRAGVMVFRDLPGMRDVEFGAGDDAFWTAETPRFPFVLEVSDRLGRYLPYTMDVLLPVRRLLGIAVGSPPASPLAGQTSSSRASLPLFSAATRPAPDAFAVVRADLVDAATGAPAAWAVLEASGPGQAMALGVADERGRVMLPLPYPRPVVSLGSPGSPSLPLGAQSWPIGFTVRYGPGATVPAAPDLASLLAQPPATAWRDTAATTPLSEGTLRFGRELVLASVTGAGDPAPALLITPGGSPP